MVENRFGKKEWKWNKEKQWKDTYKRLHSSTVLKKNFKFDF